MREQITLNRKEQTRGQVLTIVLEGRCTTKEAAGLLRVSERQLLRLKKGFREEGPAALAHGNRGRRPAHAIQEGLRQEVLQLATSVYAGYNHSHLHEELEDKHRITLSRRSISRILTAAGLRSPRKRRARRHRARRQPMPRVGMLLQVDGSRHDWLEDRGPQLVLIGAVEDATGELVHALFREQEDAAGYLTLLRETVRKRGLPLSWYSDRHGIFQRNGKEPWTLAEELAGRREPTQVARALEELGINLILAHSPQAKGRVERCWGTLQDRLVKELRQAGACTLEEANRILKVYLPRFRKRFAHKPPDPDRGSPPTGRSLQAQTSEPSAASTTSAASPTTTPCAWRNASSRYRQDLVAALTPAAACSCRNASTAHLPSSTKAASWHASPLPPSRRYGQGSSDAAATPQTTLSQPAKPPHSDRRRQLVPSRNPPPPTLGVL